MNLLKGMIALIAVLGFMSPAFAAPKNNTADVNVIVFFKDTPVLTIQASLNNNAEVLKTKAMAHVGLAPSHKDDYQLQRVGATESCAVDRAGNRLCTTTNTVAVIADDQTLASQGIVEGAELHLVQK